MLEYKCLHVFEISGLCIYVPVTHPIEQRQPSSKEDEDVVRRDSVQGHVQVIGDHRDLDVDNVSRQTAFDALKRSH